MIFYTVGMLLLLLGVSCVFNSNTVKTRDMVYYNEQQILVETAIEQGEAREDIEKKYGCNILLLSDKTYEIELQNCLQKEAFIMDYRDKDKLIGKIVWNIKEENYQGMEKVLKMQSVIIWAIFFAGGYLLLAFFYVQMIRPFLDLQVFSHQVAKGNLDFPLPVRKYNYFGAFTESFDLMREELKRARESEYQANQSKKELVAELSHDIKTPISTIRATCEVLELKEKNENTLEKIAVINGKAKMVNDLIENLLHASLEELTVLKVEPMEESSLCIYEMIQEQQIHGEIKMIGKLPECLVYLDKLRLSQVIDNCFHNAWKYANTPVTVSFDESKEGIFIQIKDEGEGVDEEELPFIMEKFYRGSNAKGKAGSGLGLYLANMFMERMQGGMEYYNENGFVVRLFLRKV